MNGSDRIVNEFLGGRLSRRQLITQLMAMGAAASGAGALARAAQQENGSTFQARSIDHIALSVTDIERSRAWYEEHLALRTTSVSRTSAFLDCGPDFLALFKGEKPGLHHYSYAIPDYSQEGAAERLREAGLEPKLRGNRTYFDDPDGIEVQVSQA